MSKIPPLLCVGHRAQHLPHILFNSQHAHDMEGQSVVRRCTARRCWMWTPAESKALNLVFIIRCLCVSLVTFSVTKVCASALETSLTTRLLPGAVVTLRPRSPRETKMIKMASLQGRDAGGFHCPVSRISVLLHLRGGSFLFYLSTRFSDCPTLTRIRWRLRQYRPWASLT